MSETICQAALLVLSGAAIMLIARRGHWERWGFVLGLLSGPFWVLTSSRSGQWGVLGIAAWYSCWYGIGACRRFRRPVRFHGRRTVLSYPEGSLGPLDEDAAREWDILQGRRGSDERPA